MNSKPLRRAMFRIASTSIAHLTRSLRKRANFAPMRGKRVAPRPAQVRNDAKAETVIVRDWRAIAVAERAQPSSANVRSVRGTVNNMTCPGCHRFLGELHESDCEANHREVLVERERLLDLLERFDMWCIVANTKEPESAAVLADVKDLLREYGRLGKEES